MAKSLWKICALAIVFARGTAGSTTITSPPKAISPRATGTSSPVASACAAASSASKKYQVDHPEATNIFIPAELAYNCMRSVPNYQEPALRLLNSLRTYLEFQSNKEYLLNPPQGYLFPSLDLDGEFDTIQKKVEAGAYESEYDMQVDIFALLTAARDGHLSWNGDLMGAFMFRRGAALAAVSSDGEEIPQVYHAGDLTVQDATGKRGPVTGYAPSPVKSIDGIDVVSFLLTQSMIFRSQDPDVLWNMLFATPALQWNPLFQFPVFYPGPSTNVTFANGTTFQYPNDALVNLPLDGVNTGDDAFSVFCSEAFDTYTQTDYASTTSSAASTTSQAPATTEAPPSSPTIPGYPYPVIKHSAGSVAGYYLNDTGLTDVAVLQIIGFEAANSDLQEYEREFQSVVEKFLDASVKTGKRKLIIDLQGNGGGFVDLGTDTFAQLFPSIAPNSKSNMRDHLGFWILGNTASASVRADLKTSDVTDEQQDEHNYTPLAYQTVVSYQFYDFPDFETYYGPYPAYGGNFTAFFQNNYTDETSSDFEGTGIVITGTNNRTGYRQPFAAQDIIVLTDGFCASTCTVFSEYLKSYAGVQFIAVGGRPQTGPMQAVGGVKGSQIFEFPSLAMWSDLFHNPNNSYLDLANGTIWENFTYEPYLRTSGAASGGAGGGVNGRNHFRIGDQTNTPLQFVYEAADCRIWYTREMAYDPTFIWSRVATMAFQERKGTQFNSKYCIANSTGHPTSISGGWKGPWLGPQEPPANARATVSGWKLEGKPLQALPPGHSTTDSAQTGTSSHPSSKGSNPTSTPRSGTDTVFGKQRRG